MSKLSNLHQSIIATICDPSAHDMANSLDHALTQMVITNKEYPSPSFEQDYDNLDRLRTAIRIPAQTPASKAIEEQPAEVNELYEPIQKLEQNLRFDVIVDYLDTLNNVLIRELDGNDSVDVVEGVYIVHQLRTAFKKMERIQNEQGKGAAVCQ